MGKRILCFFMICYFMINLSGQSIYLIKRANIKPINELDTYKLPVLYMDQQNLITRIMPGIIPQLKKIPLTLLSDDLNESELVCLTRKKGVKDFSSIPVDKVIFQTDQLLILKNNEILQEENVKQSYNLLSLKERGWVYTSDKTIYSPKEYRQIVDPAIINSINQDSIAATIQHLQNYQSRYALRDNRHDISEWIRSKLESFGYENAVKDSFYVSSFQCYQSNIVAVLPGSEFTDNCVIIGSHYDSKSNDPGNVMTIPSPGADDNASGVACMLEVARVLKMLNYQPKITIRFCAYAMEELGFDGGEHDVQKCQEEGLSIRAVFVNDMIGYQSTDDWMMRIEEYPGSEFLTQMSINNLNQLGGMGYLVDHSYLNGSDSYSYWIAGYPAVLYIENEFNPHYHSAQDVINQINMPYCRKLVQLSATMVSELAILPSTPDSLMIVNCGNGADLFVQWEAVPDEGDIFYHIKVLNELTSQSIDYVTSQTHFTITGLTEGTEYFVSLSSECNGVEGLSTGKTFIPSSFPTQISGLMINPNLQGITLNWNFNDELDIQGYKIYRSSQETTAPTFYQFVSSDQNEFSDNSVSDGVWYYYQVKAIDQQNMESLASETVKARKVSLNCGILIIDDTFNGTGSIPSPSDIQVDDFYDNLLAGFTTSHLDFSEIDQLTLSDLAPYSTILYHRNSYNLSNTFINIPIIKKYLDYGGRIIVSAYKSSLIFESGIGYPNVFNEGSFVYDYLKISQSNLISSARFKQAISLTDNFPILVVDSLKSLQALQNRLINIESITPVSEAQVIYQYDSGDLGPASAEVMNGWPVGICFNGSSFKSAVVTFPLYNMEFNESKIFMQNLLTIFNETSDTDEEPIPAQALKKDIRIYPNPFNPVTNIKLMIQSKSLVHISVYDIKGQLVKTLIDGHMVNGNMEIVWDGKDNNGRYSASGIYFCKIILDQEVTTKKMLLLK